MNKSEYILNSILKNQDMIDDGIEYMIYLTLAKMYLQNGRHLKALESLLKISYSKDNVVN